MITDGELGMAIGAGRVIRRTEQQAQQIVDRKNNELDSAYETIQKLQVALLTEQAHTAGLKAQIKALKEKVPVSDKLFKQTGRKYADGDPEINFHIPYHKAFDDFVEKLKPPFKQKVKRHQAK